VRGRVPALGQARISREPHDIEPSTKNAPEFPPGRRKLDRLGLADVSRALKTVSVGLDNSAYYPRVQDGKCGTLAGNFARIG
jgi:hypothetical protein